MQKKASVYNRYSSQGHRQIFWVLQVRSRKGSYLQEGADSSGDPILTNAVFHAMHITLCLKLGDHDVLVIFVLGHLLRRTLLMFCPRSWSRFRSVHSWVQFLSTAEASPGLPGAARQLLVGWHPTPGNSVSILYILHYFSYH